MLCCEQEAIASFSGRDDRPMSLGLSVSRSGSRWICKSVAQQVQSVQQVTDPPLASLAASPTFPPLQKIGGNNRTCPKGYRED